ncbi:Cytochrome P450 monooxygenase FUM2 [Lachnellula cervina]|uniref:Cytochrome P450 monooxygenase FUM2 n=1 Tax=Lachnellula cervina TaxID=1316786 RepID=A0A7D8UUG5_9HELO|nr:Cytochrome P450 monooxygenase FUM2 [Lachnellula cervina]
MAGFNDEIRRFSLFQQFATLAGLAASYYLIQVVYHVYFGPLSHFPGPRLRAITGLPAMWTTISGNDHEVIPALHRKYGPIDQLGPNELSFAGGARAWADIHGPKKGVLPHKDPVFYPSSINGANSLMTAGDAEHSRQRKIMSHAFSERTLKEQEPLLRSWAEKMKTKLAERITTGEEIDIVKFYNCTTFDIMADFLFLQGLDLLQDGEYSPWIKNLFNSLKTATIVLGFRRYSSWINDFIEYYVKNNEQARKAEYEHFRNAAERIDSRWNRAIDRPDPWATFLGGLTREEQHVTASALMVAGTETTATVLSGLTYHLLQNPMAMEKLKEEIRINLRNFNEVNLENLARLKYTNACLQEALRLYPPVPSGLPRVVPLGGLMICNQYIPGDHFKNPDKFAPERWLGDPEYADDHRDALEPFQTGQRNCLGQNLAWNEMRLLLATVMLHFEISPGPNSKSWIDQKVYILWEKKPMFVCLEEAKA